MNLYESLARGLKEAIEYEKGRVALPSNTMSISELEIFSPSDIKSIRNLTGLSQSAFAAAMGVSKKAVEAWEQGRNKPVGPARRVLALLEEDPKFFERTGVVVMEEVREKTKPVVRMNASSSQTVVCTFPVFAKTPIHAMG